MHDELDASHQHVNVVQRVVGKFLAKEEDFHSTTLEGKKRPLKDNIQLLEKQHSLDSNCPAFAKTTKKRKKGDVKSFLATHVATNNNKTLCQHMKRFQLVLGDVS